MPDKDIMDQLKEIDEDEILGEEVNFDADLDFAGLDDMDNPPTDIGDVSPAAPAVAPPAPQKPVAKPAAKKKARPKAAARSTPSVNDGCSPTQPDSVSPPAQSALPMTEVDEIVVRAKVLRIVADKVIIEPGNNISLSS